MDILETQVSDLRSFLTHPAGPGTAGTGTGAAVGGTAISPRHPSNASAHLPGSPLSAPGDNSALPASPFASASGTARNGAGKRKADGDDGGKTQRSKRNRYISIACNECKRRKIKCNGETPCQRCGNLNLACLYAPNCCSNNFKDSDEYKQMNDHVVRLQEQVDSLFQSMNALRQETLRLAPIQDRPLPFPSATTVASSSPSLSNPSSDRHTLPPARQLPSFRGPTSIAFTVDVAKNTLHNMGYSGEAPDDNGAGAGDTPAASPVVPFRENSQPRPRDPLWDFDKDEMIRLCRVHEDEVGIMYPVVDISDVISHARALASWMASWADAAKRNGLPVSGGQDEGISDIKTLQLKIIMCCALAVEEHGNSSKATRLWESIEPIAHRMLMSAPSDVTTLPFLALVAGYRFLSNEEILAWRVMGQVARLCLELGLHRRDGLAKIPNEMDRRNAVNTFWSAYVLDRRWSFGTGFPFVVHDDKIDPKLPRPYGHPYLVAMITYSQLGAKIWKLVDYFEPALIRELKSEDFEALDREITEWYETVPEEVRISNLNTGIPLPSTPSYNLERLQIWTRLRLNQIRIWLLTPVLHSASSIVMNQNLAQQAVDHAKETIRYLARLNNTTNLYRRIQVFYHQFLTSAIAVLFLASTHAPLQFSATCREEFYMALELVKDMSAKSWVSQRLWRTIKSLKSYAPRLGLQKDDPRSRENAAMAMTGMASSYSRQSNGTPTPSPGMAMPSPYNPPSRTSSLAPPPHPTSSSSSPVPHARSLAEDENNGLKLHTEMSKIFEGYMGMSGIPAPFDGHGTRAPWANGLTSPGELPPPGPGNDGVYQQMREMF